MSRKPKEPEPDFLGFLRASKERHARLCETKPEGHPERVWLAELLCDQDVLSHVGKGDVGGAKTAIANVAYRVFGLEKRLPVAVGHSLRSLGIEAKWVGE